MRANPMPQLAAHEVIDVARDIKKVDTRSAKRIITAWLTARGFVVDRWGNWKKPGVADERYKFKKRNFVKQAKVNGRWGNIGTSQTNIQAALNLVENAVKAVGDEKYVRHLLKKKSARKTAQKKTAVRRITNKQLEEARVHAMHWMAHEYWNLFYDALVLNDKKASNAIQRQVHPQYVELGAAYAELLRDGRELPKIKWSTSKPPLTIFFRDAAFSWREKMDSKPYSVSITNHDKQSATVHLGQSGSFGLTVDPHRLVMSGGPESANAVGDAYVSGAVSMLSRGGGLYGRMFMILARKKGRGAGLRILKLWCKLMKGYQIERWMIQALGEEGERWIRLQASRRQLTILQERGADMLVQCM